MQAVNSHHILKVLDTVRVLFTTNVLIERTINDKFSILRSAPPALCSIENVSFIVHLAQALFVNKTLATVSNS